MHDISSAEGKRECYCMASTNPRLKSYKYLVELWLLDSNICNHLKVFQQMRFSFFKILPKNFAKSARKAVEYPGCFSAEG